MTKAKPHTPAPVDTAKGGERLTDEKLSFFARIADGCEAQHEKTAIDDPEYGKCYPLDSLNLSQAAFAIRELLTEIQSHRAIPSPGREEVIEECIQAVENVFFAMARPDVHLMNFIREHLRALKAPSPCK